MKKLSSTYVLLLAAFGDKKKTLLNLLSSESQFRQLLIHVVCQRPLVDAREARIQKGDGRRPKSVTPRTEVVSARSSDRSRGGSTTARSDRSVTELDVSQASSASRESKSKTEGRSIRSDRSGGNKRSNSRASGLDSDVTEDLSTAVDSESNRKRYKRNGESSNDVSRKESTVRRLEKNSY
jgi:hypothetical protein